MASKTAKVITGQFPLSTLGADDPEMSHNPYINMTQFHINSMDYYLEVP